MDMSCNNLQNSGVKLLSVLLQTLFVSCSSIFRLGGCKLSENSCEALSSIFSYQFSSLREVDLSNNSLHDSGVTFLSVAMENPNCKLETLSGCNLSERSCKSLSTVLSSQSSNLRELDLSNNNLHDSGVKLIFGGVTRPHCTLETLRLCGCKLSENSCEALCSVFSHHPSSLRVLDLSKNNLHDSGVTFLPNGMKNPNCKLEILRSDQAIFCFLSVHKIIQLKLIRKLLHFMIKIAKSCTSSLYYENILNQVLFVFVFIFLQNTWLLCDCKLSENSCEALSAILSYQFSSLRELDLSDNKLQDTGVKLLSIGVKSPHCKLETLR
uniref:NACHT LRR and PYD domain-containing protein n=1 Tax=Amphilophus citrinellus TaxID=61819 RepID=A0A3Q0RF22_AMPCI